MAEKELLTWQAPEFREYKKNFSWFITGGAIVVLILAFEIFQKDWFGALSLAIISIFIFIFAMHKPKDISISLTSEAIHIDRSTIPYTQMKYFWIVDNDNHKTLNIETTAYLNRTILVELGQQDSAAVAQVIQQYVTQHPATEETFVQRLIHRLRF